MAALSNFLLLALAVEASAGVTEDRVATLREYAAAREGLGGGDYVSTLLSFFAPKMTICTFPAGPNPAFVKDVKPLDCLYQIGTSSFEGSKYSGTNEIIDNVAVNGTTGYILFIFDLFAVGPDGPIPGTVVKYIKEVVMFTFDDQNKIIGYEDWWEADAMARVDALVQARSKAATGTSLASNELTSHWNKTSRIELKNLASSSVSENVATLIGYTAANAGIWDGTSDFPTMYSYFAPKVKQCSFPEGPSPVHVEDVTVAHCMEVDIGRASYAAKYYPFNVRTLNIAVSGSRAFVQYLVDYCACAPVPGGLPYCSEETVVPGTTVYDVKDIVMFAFDDQHKIASYEDWWTPGTMARIDALLQAHSKAAAGTLLTSQQLIWNKRIRVEQQIASLFACLLFFMFALVWFRLVKRQEKANDSEGFQALLPA